MLHVDIPTRTEFSLLASRRAKPCVSIYLKTTPVTRDVQASRIELGNLIKKVQAQLEASALGKRTIAAIMDSLHDLLDDEVFWRYQANSLAVFVTPDSIRTYRLANDLRSMVQVADRFHLKPLFRAVTFAHSALVLCLSENAVRLLELNADLPATTLNAPGLPESLTASVGPSATTERALSGRIHGMEGHNVRLRQYVRLVDSALRPTLAGREIPLILAATGRIADLFRQTCSYPFLLPETIAESPDRLTEPELTSRARPVLDNAYARQTAEMKALFEKRTGERRTTTDISDAARAATFGAIQTLLVDIDAVAMGFLDDETGAVTFAEKGDAGAYDIIAELTARAFASGATVLAVREKDIPGGRELAAILRYSL